MGGVPVVMMRSMWEYSPICFIRRDSSSEYTGRLPSMTCRQDDMGDKLIRSTLLKSLCIGMSRTKLLRTFFWVTLLVVSVLSIRFNRRCLGRFGVIDQVYRPPYLVILFRIEAIRAVGHNEGAILNIRGAPGKLPPHLSLIFPVRFPVIGI